MKASGCGLEQQLFRFAANRLDLREWAEIETHVAGCASCREDLAVLTRLLNTTWGEMLAPSSSLWDRLIERIEEPSSSSRPARPGTRLADPKWTEVSAGIWCKLLSTDKQGDRVSLLVHLKPNVDYPPHRHAGREELYLLDGELIVNDSKIYPGDFYSSDSGTSDYRVWSETGCTCLLITSPNDELARASVQ